MEDIFKRHEDQLITYSPLFSPPTPCASPMPGDGQLKDRSWGKKSYRAHGGTGVMVPELHDPLSSVEETKKDMGANSTLAFFDKFVSNARAASEMKRRNVLDEILLHQDDPLFRWTAAAAQPQEEEEEEEIVVQQTSENTDNDTLSAASISKTPDPDERVLVLESPPPTVASSPKRSPTLSSLQPTTLAPPLESTDTANAAATSMSRPSSSASDPAARSPYATLSGLHSRWVSSLLNHNNNHNTSHHHYMPIPSSTTTARTIDIKRPHTSPSSVPNSSHGTTIHPPAHVRSPSFTSSSSSIGPISSSPFASRVSAPISGAPGFVEERYNWDKGFSDELIKELEDVEVVAAKNESDTADSTTRRSAQKLKSTLMASKENIGNGTQLTQTLIAGSAFSRISKRARGASITGGPLSSNNNHDQPPRSESLERRRRKDSSSHEPKHDGKLVSELIEKKLGSVELKGRKDITIPVLDTVLADSLRTHLPALDRLPKTWNLVYSLDQHGISLNTLYTRCEAHTQAQAQAQSQGRQGGSRTMMGSGAIGIGRQGVMVVLKDSGDALFGVWIGEGIRQSRGKGYYGSGDSFMWRYRTTQSEKEIEVYKWTGKNKYIVLGESDYVSFGGGEGRYGLYLDETLFEGSSAPCSTFDNEPLCSPGANKAGAVAFECVGLEVWGVGP